MTTTRSVKTPPAAKTPATAKTQATAKTATTAKRGTTAKTGKTASVTGARTGVKARTAKPASEAPVLSPEELAKVFELSKGSTSIELKLSIPATGHRATIKSLKLDPVEAQPRQAFFFDTSNLDLFKAGVVVRARRIQGGRGDTVVKLRPVDPDKVDPELRRSASFKIELDAMPGGFVCSASFKGVCTGREVLDMTAGKMPLSSLFSKGQRAFYKAHAPAGITMDSLVTLGPVFLLKSRHQPKDYDRVVTVEMWLYPDGSRILEVSTKCLPQETFQAIAEFKAYLASCGIALSGAQEPKTRAALEYFQAHLGE
jgi:hypothetical protein